MRFRDPKQAEWHKMHVDLFATEPVLPADDSWRERAACRNIDPSIFFRNAPQGSASTYHSDTHHDAKRVCLGCPVRAECLGDALTANDQGLRGGITYPRRRRQFRNWPYFRCHGCGVTVKKKTANIVIRACADCREMVQQDMRADRMDVA